MLFTLFGESLQVKCSHFSRNPCNWEFRMRAECVKIQVSKQVQVCHTTDSQQWPQKTTWFESDLYVSCASYIATHSRIDNGPNLSQNFTEILLVWPHIYSQICLHIINNCCIEPSLHPNILFFDNLIYINNKEQEICEKCGKN